LAFASAATGCIVERRSSYNPPVVVDQTGTGTIDTCPTISEPAKKWRIDTDIGAKLMLGTGDSVSVEYSSGGLWHVQSTCTAGYQCLFEVTAEVFQGAVKDVQGEDLESDDLVGSSCPDTAYMTVKTTGDGDGMIFTAAPGAKVRVTASARSHHLRQSHHVGPERQRAQRRQRESTRSRADISLGRDAVLDSGTPFRCRGTLHVLLSTTALFGDAVLGTGCTWTNW